MKSHVEPHMFIQFISHAHDEKLPFVNVRHPPFQMYCREWNEWRLQRDTLVYNGIGIGHGNWFHLPSAERLWINCCFVSVLISVCCSVPFPSVRPYHITTFCSFCINNWNKHHQTFKYCAPTKEQTNKKKCRKCWRSSVLQSPLNLRSKQTEKWASSSVWNRNNHRKQNNREAATKNETNNNNNKKTIWNDTTTKYAPNQAKLEKWLKDTHTQHRPIARHIYRFRGHSAETGERTHAINTTSICIRIRE